MEFATVSQLLGHAGVTTTMRSARGDLDLKPGSLSSISRLTTSSPSSWRTDWAGGIIVAIFTGA
jgi:integrase/recombinase XerD